MDKLNPTDTEIKCDEEGCHWNLSLEWSEIPSWHNVKCPRCKQGIIVNNEDLNAFSMVNTLISQQEILNPEGIGKMVSVKISTESLRGNKNNESQVIPAEILDLVRFLAETWVDIDKFVYANCDGDSLANYPIVQGTTNQINLTKIGNQKYSLENLREAINWMLKQQ